MLVVEHESAISSVLSLSQTSKFTCASDIPVEFLRKNVKLRGRVHRVTEDGLEIEHIPIALPILARWKRGEGRRIDGNRGREGRRGGGRGGGRGIGEMGGGER